ncbi:hypothetical protein IJ00_15525 [Calothrix sp. 336/3]|nr:hypothetical protein IJ00_15525 [Calothrix sp. 336/3]
MSITGTIFCLFFPACLGILAQVIWGNTFNHQILALAMFFFGIEQARMAKLDLQLVHDAQKQVQDVRLQRFKIITIITIILELCGFYLASMYLGWGAIIILLSQIWFNLLVEIKINPNADKYIKPWKITERLPVLFADILGLILMSLWILEIADLWITWILFVMLIIYLSAKAILFMQQIEFFPKHLNS